MNRNLKYYLSLPYTTILEYEPGDNTWVAFCPELGRGSCYAIGETREEALDLLEQAKKDILKYALNEGYSIPEPKFEEEELPSGQFIIRLPRTLHKKLKDEAQKENVSLNQYVVSIMAEYVGTAQTVESYSTRINSVQAVREKNKKYKSNRND